MSPLPTSQSTNGPEVDDLWQLIYASGATVAFAEADVKNLVAAAQSRNRAWGITGLLIYYQGSFLQILEGPMAAVEQLYEQIQTDPRHARVLLLERRPITQRDFPGWDLELFEFTATDAVQAELGQDAARGVCATDLSVADQAHVPLCIPDHCLSPRLQLLLKQFRAGQWRRAFDCRRSAKLVAPICLSQGQSASGIACGLPIR
jgi:hypothetical protein